ncbi:enamidase [Natranaerovirga pectinivora]|uniref:Enamidase n=1 Tax=Natranaerovirga pectinivora TaxID=682400 RepID=A0A4R3MMR2_9FIRM|nr:amidohydrolase family protein [Natranaerovirga pectinivora]TCT16269.1 enamidase [Natranaerovirga pectinivora]
MMKRLLLLILIMIIATGCNTNKGRTIILENVTVIDGNGGEPLEDAVVVVEGEVITFVGKVYDFEKPEKAVTYDLQGATLLPGFINAHVHNAYSSKNLSTWAKSGITTVRDLGCRIKNPYEVRGKLLKSNKNARLVAAGPFITTTQGYGDLEVNSLEDAVETVQLLIDNNTDLIKVSYEDNLQGQRWNKLPKETLQAIVSLAHENNLRVSVHVSHRGQLEDVIDAKVDDLAHMVIDLLSDELIYRIVEEEIYWVPTLELWKGVSEDYPRSSFYIDIAKKNLKKFYEAGGKVALGTDFGGYHTPFELGMPIMEIRLMEAAGMTPMDIIVSATKNAAYVCNLEDEIGTIEVGKIADILIVKGNPLEELNFLLDVRMVLRNGQIIVNKK